MYTFNSYTNRNVEMTVCRVVCIFYYFFTNNSSFIHCFYAANMQIAVQYTILVSQDGEGMTCPTSDWLDPDIPDITSLTPYT